MGQLPAIIQACAYIRGLRDPIHGTKTGLLLRSGADCCYLIILTTQMPPLGPELETQFWGIGPGQGLGECIGSGTHGPRGDHLCAASRFKI